MTNGDILETFGKKYPKLRVKDYRPLCPEMFTNDLVGITIWLENGDVIQYYPKEAQKDKKQCNTCEYKHLESECLGCAEYDEYDNLVDFHNYKKEAIK